MTVAVGVVRAWQVDRVEGDERPLNAASLAKQVIGHVALALLDDLDERVDGDITVRHVLSHTSGLPNWRPPGQPLRPLCPPGERFTYSGEGIVLLEQHLERRFGVTLDDLVHEHVFTPLAMHDSSLGPPEVEFAGNRPLFTTALDYARFLAHVLTIDDERWRPQHRIDDELAWGAGWGLELGTPVWGWQWGQNLDTSAFVIGCPATGDGVVVLTDLRDGRPTYRAIIERELPGDHPSLRVEHNETWLALFA